MLRNTSAITKSRLIPTLETKFPSGKAGHPDSFILELAPLFSFLCYVSFLV